MGDQDLGRYQAALLALLARKELGPEERMRILREDEAFAPYASYVAGCEARLVDLGAAITQKWGRPEE